MIPAIELLHLFPWWVCFFSLEEGVVSLGFGVLYTED